MTASTSFSARLSARSVVTWPMPYLAATSLVLSRSRLISETTSTPSMLDAVEVLDAEGAGAGQGDFDGLLMSVFSRIRWPTAVLLAGTW
jgi:hypothetical protein